MPKKPQMTLRSGKALANAAPVLPQSRSDRRSQTLMLDDEEEEPLVRKRLRRSYQQTSSSSVSDHHGNNDDRQKELSLPAATLPSASTASRNASPTSAQNAMALTFLMSPPSSIQQNQQSSYRLQPPTLHPPLSQISANTPIARIVAQTGQWKTLAPKQDVKGKGTKQTDVKGDRQQLTRFWRRPEINALVDWVLIPGNYESLRVENAKKAGRTVNDVYGDVARRVFNMTGNGTTDDTATVPQRVHQECPNFYEMLSIFRTPSLSKPINTTTAHSTGPTAIAKAGEAEIIDTELSDDEPIRLTQNLISVMGSLTQVLGSLSGNGTGASSSGRDYFINRIEQLERKLEQQNEHITQQKDIICGLQIKLARAGIPF
ncbi:hypothetical protein BGZ90_007826 [Linnemannia elongata]|nr:hypothetical protein BGZ90_007826 [Linnemannia elongata]